MQGLAYLALGSNLTGPWGTPEQCISGALDAISAAGIDIVAISRQFKTESLSGGQAAYLNAVVAVRSDRSVGALLRLAKTIERRAGRRQRYRWGPRTLDIDIIMAGTRSYNWPHRGAGSLTLPHPEMHRRAFVLAPLCEVAPHWRHPGLGVTAAQLRHRLPPRAARSAQLVSRR